MLVAVVGAKGGVGATVVAVNLAVLLARQAPGDVCLVDLQPCGGGLSSTVDLQHHGLTDLMIALEGEEPGAASTRIDVRPYAEFSPRLQFRTLSAPWQPLLRDLVTRERRERLTASLDASFAASVLDMTLPDFLEDCASGSPDYDAAVIVATCDVAPLRRAREAVGAWRARRREDPALILNAAQPRSPVTPDDARSFLGVASAAAVPWDGWRAAISAFEAVPLLAGDWRHSEVASALEAALAPVLARVPKGD